MTEVRPRPEDFLEIVERAKRGRLKVYIGPAAGVGKTYRMLEEAHALRRRGVDVVLGFIETHGRAETAALLEGLDQVPRQRSQYRGLDVDEMDLDAVLARRPQVAVVDEIAHTNVPGSRNRKRYQDVVELLDAGINVICAFNVQHLESLKDVVERVTGVTIRETVPDTFLKQADQVVNLDLDAEDLLERLRSGRIYEPAKVEWALAHFFKEDKLSSLRELALREVAERLDSQAAAFAADRHEVAPPRASGRVMVCMASASPRVAALLRRGSRLAGRLNTDWFVVYVETPDESPLRIAADAQRYLIDNIARARELGAQVRRLQARDPVPALLAFARSHGVSHIIVGQSHQPWWKRRLGLTFVHRMLLEAGTFDLHIVPLEDESPA
jgi:two-component system, OmpR family, sensor histidine kinase KdpD